MVLHAGVRNTDAFFDFATAIEDSLSLIVAANLWQQAIVKSTKQDRWIFLVSSVPFPIRQYLLSAQKKVTERNH